MLKCSSGVFLTLKHARSLSESCICSTVNNLTAIFFTFQLGFGSFLGIIGAHLIENKRQMVRGFVLPLCIEITVTGRSQRAQASSRLGPAASPKLDYIADVTIELQSSSRPRP